MAAGTTPPTPTHTRTAAIPSPTRTGAPQLELALRVSGRARAGAVLQYVLAYANGGSSTVEGIVLNAVVPDGTAFHSPASSDGWRCTGTGVAGDACSFDLPPVAPGAAGEVQFALMVSAPNGSVIRGEFLLVYPGGEVQRVSANVGVGPLKTAPALDHAGQLVALLVLLLIARARLTRGKV